jgi:replicative DNA helicase
MPKEQLARRMVCAEARLDLSKLRQGFLSSDEWVLLTEGAGRLASLPMWIDDTPALSLLELRAKVRRLQAEARGGRSASAGHPPGAGQPGGSEPGILLVIVDYLQLMQGRRSAASREQEISEISRGLKQLAKELDVVVIALSQLNRGVETRGGKDKRPMLADLRESGAIEQDADTIIFIYRDDYYNPDTTDAKGLAELIVAKQRNGPTGTVQLAFLKQHTRFEDLARGGYGQG